MKIFHIVSTLSAGGAELHLLTLCRYLKRAGVEVIVAYLKKVKGSRFLQDDFTSEGIRVFNLNGDQIWDIRYLYRAFDIIYHENPDILHTHLPRADLVGFINHILNPSVPWICSIHDIYSKNHLRWRLVPIFNFIWGQADRIIAISEGVEKWLVMQNPKFLKKKVQIIHYGIDVEYFKKSYNNLRSSWNLEGKLIIGSIGRLEPRKGHEILILAMPLILKQIPNAILLIAGHDPWNYGQTLQNLIKQLNLESSVQLIGFQSDIPSFLHAIDVFAFASKSEGFGQVVIEAMAAGKPVVASKISPLTEIIEDGVSGFLVERDPRAFANLIIYLLKNPKEAKLIGNQAIRRVQQYFTAEAMTTKTLELYQQVLEEKQRRNKGYPIN
jgi:glycosyltransferase involved in cell wall biosynthesis